jgi:hypothetical protein
VTATARHAALAAAACPALGAAIVLQIARDRWYPRSDIQAAEIVYVRSPAALQRFALEYDGLLADVYWIRTVQYYGGNRLTPQLRKHHYELLYPMLDIATSLDPYFNIAYRFGAIFLGEGYPGGPGRPDLAIALLRKGIAMHPGKWQYYLDAGFVNYFHLHDYHAAADWFARGSRLPNAPNWLLPLSAAMLTRGNDRASARFLWQQLLGSEEAWLRRNATRALAQLDALDQIDRLEAIVRKYPPPEGQSWSWAVLIRRGVLPGIPVDPSRTPYEIDPATGRVSVSETSELYPLPLDAARQVP